MGRVVEILRKNTLERDELLIDRAQAADRLEKQVEERTVELAQSLEELRALGDVSQAVNSTIDLQTVLSTIIAKAVQLSGTEAGTIFVFDEASQEFHVRASYGMDETLIAAVKDQKVHLGETILSQSVLQRTPMQLADATQETSSLVLDIDCARWVPCPVDHSADRPGSDRRCTGGPSQGAGRISQEHDQPVADLRRAIRAGDPERATVRKRRSPHPRIGEIAGRACGPRRTAWSRQKSSLRSAN